MKEAQKKKINDVDSSSKISIHNIETPREFT